MSKPLRRIMIIDDDDVNNFLCSKIISKSGVACDIETHLTGVSALQSMQKANPDDLPDLLFLDINMPVMTGWDFLDEFRKIKLKKKEEIKIIMLSSSIYQKDLDKAEAYSEVTDYVTKPLSISKMVEINENYFKK